MPVFNRAFVQTCCLKRILLCLMLGVSGLSAQAVRAQNILVAVPDTSVLTTQARIPLWIDDISAHDVQGFLFTITYDSTHFAIDDVDINGHRAAFFDGCKPR